MATVAVIFGGMAGFFSALIALILFNASWLLAMGLWAMGGLGVATLLVVLSRTARRPRLDLNAEHA